MVPVGSDSDSGSDSTSTAICGRGKKAELSRSGVTARDKWFASASLTAAIARPPSAHLASPAASSKQIPADFVFCFVAVHRAQCPTRWDRSTKEINNATDTQKRRKGQGRRAGEMLHRQCRGMQLSTCLQVQPGLAAMRVMQMMFGTCNLGAREVD